MDDTRTERGAATVGAHSPAPMPPARPGPSLRPALLVVGIAAFLVLLFGIGAAVSNQGTPAAPSSHAVKVAGTGLQAVPAASALRPIEQGGQPPANIIDAVRVPKGATAGAAVNDTEAAGQYDQQMHFSVSSSQGSVVDFYKIEMKRDGWDVTGPNPADGVAGGVEVLGEKGGDDGWYWEMGAVVSPTTFHGDRETTPFVLTLFQVPDDE